MSGRKPVTTHPIYDWMETLGLNQTELAGRVEARPGHPMSHQALSHYTTGRRAIPRALADRWERESRGVVPWRAWPLVVDQHGRHYHHGTLVPPADLKALRERLAPAPEVLPPPASLQRES